jgi:hypothetical protein
MSSIDDPAYDTHGDTGARRGERATRMGAHIDAPVDDQAPPAEPPLTETVPSGEYREGAQTDRGRWGEQGGPAPEAYDEPVGGRGLDDRGLDDRDRGLDDRMVGDRHGAAAEGGPRRDAPAESFDDAAGYDEPAGDAGRRVPEGQDPRDQDARHVSAADPGRTERREPAAATGPDTGDGTRAVLVPQQRSDDYRQRWEMLKAQFVDEPRSAVREADELVGQVLDEVEATFRRQREDLERDLHDDSASTEDLRLALGRYRSFFDRLLSF